MEPATTWQKGWFLELDFEWVQFLVLSILAPCQWGAPADSHVQKLIQKQTLSLKSQSTESPVVLGPSLAPVGP